MLEHPLGRAIFTRGRARVPDLTKRPIFGAVGVVLRTWTVVCEIIPIFFQYLEGEWRFGEREICNFFTGCTSSSSNGNRSIIQAAPNTRTKEEKIKEEDQKKPQL